MRPRTSAADKNTVDGRGGLRGAVVRGGSATAAAFAGTQGLNFLIYVVLARLAPPEVFGTFAAGSILLGVGEMVSESGMTAALVQRRDRVEEAAATALLSTAIGAAALTVVALALSPVVGLAFQSTEIALVSAALSGSLLLGGVTGVPGAMLQRRISARRWTIVEPIAALVFGFVAGVTLASGLGVWGLVLAWYASGLARVVSVWTTVRWRPKLRLASFAMWKELAGFGRHILMGEVLRESMRVGSSLAVGRSLGTSALGEFRFGFRLVSQATLPILGAGAWTLQPALVRLGHDRLRVRQAVLRTLSVVTYLAFPLAAGFIPLGETIAVVVFGEDWRGSGLVMVALAGMGMALAVESPASEVYKALGRPDIIPRYQAIWALSTIGLVVLLAPQGAAAAGFAWSISTTLVAAVAAWSLPKVVDVRRREILACVGPQLLVSLMAAVALVLVQRALGFEPQANVRTALELLVQVAALGVSYISVMRIVAPETSQEVFRAMRLLINRESAV